MPILGKKLDKLMEFEIMFSDLTNLGTKRVKKASNKRQSWVLGKNSGEPEWSKTGMSLILTIISLVQIDRATLLC